MHVNISKAHVAASEVHRIKVDHVRNAFILSGDDDRFTNHSDDLNTSHHDNEGYAVRDINAGEEITGDYNNWGGKSPEYNWQVLRAASA